MRCLDLGNVATPPRSLPPPRTFRHPTSSPRTIGTHSLIPRQPQPVHLRETKEAPSIHEEIILTKSRIGAHGSSGMGHHLQHMVATHRPREVNNGTAGIGVVHLLPVRQDETFAGRDAPYHRDVVLLAPACRASLPRGEGVGVGEAEAPSDATFGVGDTLTACHCGEVDRILSSVNEMK